MQCYDANPACRLSAECPTCTATCILWWHPFTLCVPLRPTVLFFLFYHSHFWFFCFWRKSVSKDTKKKEIATHKISCTVQWLLTGCQVLDALLSNTVKLLPQVWWPETSVGIHDSPGLKIETVIAKYTWNVSTSLLVYCGFLDCISLYIIINHISRILQRHIGAYQGSFLSFRSLYLK